MTQATLSTWAGRNQLNNSPFDVTFVLGDARVIYNTKALYAGSPYIAPVFASPAATRCGYSLEMPGDELFLGDTDLVLDWPGGHGSETTALQEQMGYWIADRLDLPFSHRYHIRLHVNGVTDDARHYMFEAVMQPGRTFVETWSPEDSNGDFFKIDRAFEFNDSGSLSADPQPRLQNFTTSGGAKKREKYRWNFMFRAADRVNDYTNLFALVDAVNSAAPEPYTSATMGLVDLEQWMRIFATEHIIVNFDSYGHDIGKNMYAYLPRRGKWQLYMFDIDWLMLPAVSLNSSYAPGTAPLFNCDDPTIARMYSFPPFARAYWRAVQDAVNGPLDPANCNPVMDAKYRSLVANGIVWCDNKALTDPAAVKTWFSQRRAALQSQLATVASPFTVNSSVTVSNGVGVLSGTAPVEVKTISVNGADWLVRWTTVSNWVATVPLQPGNNTFNVVGVNARHQQVPGASNSVPVVYNGAAPSPVNAVVINEIMFKPALPDAEYVELFNTSSNYSYDLSGWEFNGLDYTFPNGTFLGPRSFLLLAKDRAAFNVAYGANLVVFDQYSGNLQSNGETLSLIKRGVPPTPDLVVDRVRYEAAAPWPEAAPGVSLQLLDPLQDDSRVANWSAVTNAPATPGTSNSLPTVLAPFPAVWLNEAQPDNVTGPLDNAGQHEPWVELHNSDANALSLAGFWLSDSYTNLTQWAFPSNTVVAAGAFLLVWCDNQTNQTATNALHTNFRLPSGAGNVALSRAVSNGVQMVDYLSYANLPANWSYGDYPDGQPFYRAPMFAFTPGAANTNASPPIRVFINEWLADNAHTLADPADGGFEDWFEIYNPGATAVDLGGYFLTDSLTNKFQFEVPNNGHYRVPAGGYLLVWADNETSQNNTNRADLHVNFALSKDGDSIALFAADGTTIDAVSFGAQTNDVSQGRFPNGASRIFSMPTPTPRAANVVPNTAPELSPIGNQEVTLGQTLRLAVSATDTDLPPQTLTFTLGANSPGTATLGPASGLFAWAPAVAPATNSVTVMVSDNGTPSLSATQTFLVTVYLPPTVTIHLNGNQLQLTWPRGILQQADNVTGPYSDLPGVSPVTVDFSANRKFYRIRM
jgi:hypothetical protein